MTLRRGVALGSTLALAALTSCGSAPAPRTLAPDRAAYERALVERSAFRAELEAECDDVGTIDRTIAEAIAIGAPIYNAGSPLGCYRIYEGAAYKLLFELNGTCPNAAAVLETGLASAGSSRESAEKAWTMRRTFDALLGEGTRTLPPPSVPERGL